MVTALFRICAGSLSSPASGRLRWSGCSAATCLRPPRAMAQRAVTGWRPPERLGVAIGVETHDAFAASSVVAELLAMTGSPVVGAVWDSHHPHRMGESPAEVAANLAGRIFLAQVKDARRAPERPDGWRLVLLGEGEVPVPEMLALLGAAGYRGWVSVEWEKRWHPEIEEPEIALPQHLAVLRQWMEDTGG